MKIRRIFAAMLLIVMLLASSFAAAESEGNLNLTGLPIVNTPETIRIVFCKHDMDSTQNNLKYAVQKAAQETNVLIEWEEIPQIDFAMKVSLMFAGGNLPDMFLTDGGDNYVTSYRSQLLPLEELLARYAPEMWKIISEPEMLAEFKHDDGHVYSIPSGLASNEQNDAPGLFIYNRKYFDEVGYLTTNVDELYTALQQHVVDGEDCTVFTAYLQGFFYVEKYETQLNMTAASNPLIIARSTWEKMTEDEQALFMECYQEAEQYGIPQSAAYVDEYTQKAIDEKGVEVILRDELSDEVMDEFRTAVQPVWDKYSQSVSPEYYQAFLDACARVRGEA